MKLYKVNDEGKYVEATDLEIRQAHIENDELIDVFWGVEDVRSSAEQEELFLTDDQIGNIVGAIEDNHDANIGLDWDNISFHISNTLTYEERLQAEKAFKSNPKRTGD